MIRKFDRCLRFWPAIAAVAALVYGGCDATPSTAGGGAEWTGAPMLAGKIEIDGFSTVFRLYAGVHELFQEEQPESRSRSTMPARAAASQFLTASSTSAMLRGPIPRAK